MSRLDWRRDGRDWPLDAHSRFVKAGALDWHVQRLGQGPRVLLLHGTGASTHSWRDVAPLLADRFELLSPDLPGHGFTRGRPAGGLALPAVAKAVAQMLAAEDFTPALVVGHSAGAAVALQLTLAEGVAAPVVAFAPALRPMGGAAAPFFSGLAGLLLANPFTSLMAAGMARHVVDVGRFLERATGSRIDARGVALYARLFGSPSHVEGAMGLMAQWDLAPLATRLGSLPTPLVIAHGDRDATVPLAESRTVAGLARARLEVLAGLGHLAHEERPELAAHIVTQAVEESVP